MENYLIYSNELKNFCYNVIDLPKLSNDFNYIDFAVDKKNYISYIPMNKINRFDGDFFNKDLRQKFAVMTKAGKFFGKFGITNLEQISAKFNVLNSDEKQFITTNDFAKYYDGDSYRDESGNLGSSCMRSESCYEYFDIYSDNDNVKLLVLLESDKVIGRSIIWSKVNFGDAGILDFMDRIYVSDDNDTELFKQYAKKNNMVTKRRQSYEDKKGFVYKGYEFARTINISLDYTDFSYYPYVDTLSFLSGNTLSNDNDNCEKSLIDTSGDYENMGNYSDYHDEFIPEDESVFCDELSTFMYNNEVVEINGEYYHNESESICYSDIDNDHHLIDDCIFIEHNDTYVNIHQNSVIETPNGIYYLLEDCNEL